MKKTNMDNKGFSLVELIIVIAIMAILVAIVGSQVVPYIEKSRVSKDLQTLDAVYQSFQATLTTYATNNVLPATINCAYYGLNTALSPATGLDEEMDAAVKLGTTAAAASARFVSKAANGGTLTLYYNDATGEIAVHIGNLSVSSINSSQSTAAFVPATVPAP